MTFCLTLSKESVCDSLTAYGLGGIGIQNSNMVSKTDRHAHQQWYMDIGIIVLDPIF